MDKKKKPFNAFDHGKDLIDLTNLTGKVFQALPIEIHHKANGSKTDHPSFAIVMKIGDSNVVGEISLEMLNNALQDINYRLIKTVS